MHGIPASASVLRPNQESSSPSCCCCVVVCTYPTHACVFPGFVWQEVLRSLYPGCPFEREVVGLELVQLVLSELLPAGEPGASKATLSKVQPSPVYRRSS